MAKKQVTTTQKTAAAAAPARLNKPAASRVSTAKHSKSGSQETAATPVAAVEATNIIAERAPVIEEIVVAEVVVAENPHAEISGIAYGYWVARGYHGGSAHEDWVRAEREYLKGK